MWEMTQPTTYESYFEARLREAACRDEVAAPATIDSLAESLNSYLPPPQVADIERAYEFARHAHDGQMRRTQHPYITHPLAVATILAEMRMDDQSIAAALLHDVLEDTGATKERLADSFGEGVAGIVDGVSKLATIFNTHEQAQAENFQKMAMATARDLRVILVKLADRLHNMRTIGALSGHKRRRIAKETLDLYAPIANRLGMHNVKIELEDLAFNALYLLRSDRLRRAVASARGNRKALMDELGTSIEAALRREGIDAAVRGREKHLYSIYAKMKTQRKPFTEIMDVFGFRIVVDQVDACYRALGVMHNLYKPVLGRFKDYVAIPKANGYQSLHTTLFGMHGVPIEVQIRTRQMDAVADHGVASHWFYKSPADTYNGGEARARQWVQGLLELQQRAGDPLEFVENLKIDLFPDEVYVFTPRGDILELPRGACAIDFAYAVHTDIGNHCVACRIDRALAPLSRQLQSGQTVEILTTKDARPSPDWLTFVVSGRARSAIRQALKVQQRSESIALGRALLDRSLRNADTSIKRLDFRRLRKVFREFGVRKLDDLLAEIGLGNRLAYVVAQRLLSADNPNYEAVDIERGGPVAIRGGEGLVISYSRCCGPVPGDAVIGHMTPERGFVVHMDTCPNLEEVRRRKPNEIIPARWAESIAGEFDTSLLLSVRRRKGVIAQVAASMNESNAGINNIHVEERNAELSNITVDLSVADVEHLNRIVRRLSAINTVQNVRRPAVAQVE